MDFLLALGLGVALALPVGRLATAVSLVDEPDGRLKIHSQPIPLAGAAAIGAALGARAIVGGSLPAALLAGAAVGTLVGLADDARPLPAWIRLVALASAGGALIAGGAELDPLGPLATTGVVLLVLACANGVNFLDGQDGLAPGLVAIAALGLAGLSAGTPAGAGPGLAVAGACAGFLVWNRPPARLFLGNGGAYGLGVLLAALVVPVTVFEGWRGLLSAGICLGVLALELALTVVRRVGSGARLFSGDRGHSYDLLAAEIGRTNSTLAIWAIGALLSGLAQAVVALPLAVGAALAAFLAALGLGAGVELSRRRASADEVEIG